ncbi:hypothetical protein LEP1GSC052_0301 [Leptospira kmetyi serovar Malaysia str. Bejo-Iso9]|nr:hypothetical protein LEP1GSC052_0301 [Leptospira kmetyi serovar Malaysia str. Bejo-Iso9]
MLKVVSVFLFRRFPYCFTLIYPIRRISILRIQELFLSQYV